VPLSFALGEAFQFDWSEEGLLIGGIYRRMQVAHLKLCASSAFWLVAYPSQGHEMLFDAHTRAFSALGGVPRLGIYDNMKTAVDKANKGKGRTVNARFAVMRAHYLFDPDFCNVAAGWEKGIVEKNVQDSRRRIWLDAQDHQFHSFEALNAWLGRVVARFGASCRTRTTAASVWPRCWNWSGPNLCLCPQPSTVTLSFLRGCPAPARSAWDATATRCLVSTPVSGSAAVCIRPGSRW
jgi:hypothetical protein